MLGKNLSVICSKHGPVAGEVGIEMHLLLLILQGLLAGLLGIFSSRRRQLAYASVPSQVQYGNLGRDRFPESSIPPVGRNSARSIGPPGGVYGQARVLFNRAW